MTTALLITLGTGVSPIFNGFEGQVDTAIEAWTNFTTLVAAVNAA